MAKSFPPIPATLPPLDEKKSQRLSRRTLLKAAGVGSLYLLLGSLVYRHGWQLGTPAAGKVCLTEYEFLVCEKVAEAFFPGPPTMPLSAAQAHVPQFLDAYFGGLYDSEQRMLKWLFAALDVQPVFRHAKTFSELSLSKRQQVLEGWAQSQLSARRMAYQTLRFASSLGYFENAEVRTALGLRHGCPLPGRADPSPIF